ncbi:MAG TPA: archease [Gemmatimonadota bacterium]|nr:archease [Gemmatimonadota bacterium]
MQARRRRDRPVRSPPRRCPLERIEELAHTADVGFRLLADTEEGLFRAAAEGLRRAIGHEAAAAEGAAEPVRLGRPDRERLLVAWLRELLAGGETRRAVPEPIDLRIGRGPEGEPTLEAIVVWRPRAGSGPAREIKGVTYHGLEVTKRDGRWSATVVLDV